MEAVVFFLKPFNHKIYYLKRTKNDLNLINKKHINSLFLVLCLCFCSLSYLIHIFQHFMWIFFKHYAIIFISLIFWIQFERISLLETIFCLKNYSFIDGAFFSHFSKQFQQHFYGVNFIDMICYQFFYFPIRIFLSEYFNILRTVFFYLIFKV